MNKVNQTVGAGKGDKSRVRDLRRFQAGYDSINWARKPAKPSAAAARRKLRRKGK